MPQYIKKRTGHIVPFDAKKIEDAIFAAAESVGGEDRERARVLSGKVMSALNTQYEGEIPDVESVQDVVEKILIEDGHAKTAKSYILYRAKKSEERKEAHRQLLEKMKHHEIEVVHEDGTRSPFETEKIIQSVQLAAQNLHVNAESIVMDAITHLYPGVAVKEIELSIINAAKSKIELHTDYSYLSSRLLLQKLYKEVFQFSVVDNWNEVYPKYIHCFKDYIKEGITQELLTPLLQEFNLDILAHALKPERDNLFQFLGIQTLQDRYLIQGRSRPKRTLELPQWMWMRVAMGLALKEENKEERAIEFYNVLSQMLFVSSTPTLFNSGTCHSQMSSCYLNTVEDSLDHIFKVYGDNAQLSKWAGGIGTDWTYVRSKNSKIKGTNGSSQGVIPFLKIFNDTALAVNQGGKRKGAMCAYLEVWHADIEEFMEAKKNTGDERRRLHDINTAVWIPDLFMKRVQNNQSWTLFSPSEVADLHDLYGQAFEKRYETYESMNLPSARVVDALTLWKKHLTMLYETGHPWVTFKDAANIRSPQSHVGVIHNSNLCTEITLNTSKEETAVCNLGSINLSLMIENKALNEEKIASTVSTAMRMLDNVIDTNFYPTKEAEISNKRHRPVGLGLMGYADALYQMGIAYDSEEQLNFADISMECIAYHTILASSKLAQERGVYPSYKGSKWDQGILPHDTVDLYEKERQVPIICNRQVTKDWSIVRAEIQKHGMRNSNCMAIAPTATISNISGCTPCTEPTFKNIYMKENLSGSFVIINPYLVSDLEERGLWSNTMSAKIKLADGSVQNIEEIPFDIRQKYKETFEIDAEWIINGASRRGKWIDQSASTNIFMKTTSGKKLYDTYMLAWQTGLKTTYYLRTLAVTQIEKTVEMPVAEAKPLPMNPLLAQISDQECEACQ